MFRQEQNEYINEGVDWKNIKFKDNQKTIDLIQKRDQASIFRLLDEQFMLQRNGSDANFLKSINSQLAGSQ